MISVRRLPRAEWEAELRSYGCAPATGLTALNTAEWWRYPWGGYPFTVPHDADGMIRRDDLDAVVVTMASLAPDDWSFPDPA